MAITRIATSSLKTLNKYDSFLGGNTAFIPNSYESISTVTVGVGGSSSISFTSIPSTFKHLQVRYIAKCTSSASADIANLQLQFNSDTSSSYVRHYLYGNGSSALVGVSGIGTKAVVGAMPNSYSSYANMFNAGVVDILDYTNTNKNKTVRSLSGEDMNDASTLSRVWLESNLYTNTTAISTITFTPESGQGNIAQYSQFALYGIKG